MKNVSEMNNGSLCSIILCFLNIVESSPSTICSNIFFLAWMRFWKWRKITYLLHLLYTWELPQYKPLQCQWCEENGKDHSVVLDVGAATRSFTWYPSPTKHTVGWGVFSLWLTSWWGDERFGAGNRCQCSGCVSGSPLGSMGGSLVWNRGNWGWAAEPSVFISNYMVRLGEIGQNCKAPPNI